MAALPGPVFFDVDGVLVDSLPAHLAICRRLASIYRLDLDIPDVARFRALISNGFDISPMLEFFRAVGFPAQEAEEAVRVYERDFAREYAPPLFPGVEAMLRRLHAGGHPLGIVTSNTLSNIAPVLGGSLDLFDARCLFTKDRFRSRNKAWCLAEGADILGYDRAVQDCLYVGDLPSDARAATEAGYRFLAVTYGWGFGPDEKRYTRATSPSDIAEVAETLFAFSD